MKIIDNFIDSYSDLKKLSIYCKFSDIKNPTDNVTYPNIYSDIPEKIKKEIMSKLCNILHREPEKIMIFMRQSPFGVDVPHIAHHDLSMGLYSLMLYLNDNHDGGTAFIRHKATGMSYAPEDEDFVKIAQFDQNNTDKWAILNKVEMKQNRAVIFDAGLFHCAMPIGGFGEGLEARTVLTCFFS